MERFFSPKAVAVIGASRNPGKPGHVIFRNFIERGFEGDVYPVNPKAEEIFGQKCYHSVKDIPKQIDLAIVAVPAEIVPKVLDECGRKKIRAAVIISGGFKEVGNAKLEDKVKESLRKNRIRAVGVNCIGIYDPHSKVDMIFNPTYKLERPQAGDIAFITQSGAVGTVILDWMGMKGYKISKFVSYGNATDIDETDLIEHLSKDEQTKVICAFLEGVKEGRKFFDIARKLSRKKPIIALKGGTTEEGHKTVSSHTGSLAGSAEVYSAAFRQAGIVQAEDMEELFDFARVLSTQPLPKGNRVQVITDGGGFGVLMVDWLVRCGLKLAEPKAATLSRLKKAFPKYFVLGNPIDLTGNATTEHYAAAVEAAIADPNTDMVVIIILFQVPALTPDVIEVIAEAKSDSKKPVIVVASGGRYTEVLKKSLEDRGVPCFSYPERAAKSLAMLSRYAEYRE